MIGRLIDKIKDSKDNKIFYVFTSVFLAFSVFFGSVATEILVNPVSAPASLPALPADDIISFTGRGWGHGIGMCQYGAYGQAKKGRNYQQILNYYYKDTTIGTSTNPVIRVELLSGQGTAGVTGTGGFVLKNNRTNAVIANGTAGQIWTALPDGAGKISVKNPSGKIVGTYSDPVRFEPNPVTSSSLLKVTNNGRRYRGFVVVRLATTSSVRIINNVVLEDYVKGIAEIPASWPTEALKAQAVAARTYAVSKMNRSATFDMYSDQRSQVYMGYEKEVSWMGSSWVSASKATSGKVVKHNGAVITAYYFSTCGGSTENSEHVWSSSVPYLKAKSCDYCSSSPKYKWKVTFKVSDLANKLNASPETRFTGKLAGIGIVSRKGPRRVGTVSIYSTDGRRDVTGDALRRALSLNSTWFDINDLKISGIGVKPNPFSPDGDGVTDRTNFLYTINRNANINIKIYNYKGLAATALNNSSRPAGSNSHPWNGKNDLGNVVVDGTYRYVIAGVTGTGSKASVSGLVIVKNAPVLTNVRASPNPFSPNGDGDLDRTYIRFTLDKKAKVSVKIFNSKGTLVANVADAASRLAGNRLIKWNGLNKYSKIVRDGTYTVKVTAFNNYGSSTQETKVKLNGKPRISGVSFLPNPFTPNGDSINDSALLKLTTNVKSTLNISITDTSGKLVRNLANNKLFEAGIYKRRWYGKDGSGNVVGAGTYNLKIKATNASGTRLITRTIQVD